ncbi:hypothetical protein GCM10011514_39370 [Emticicia aquatilis]|uniref:DUF1573 domain-containing protein n=1 Tax=Emticicia aquatilis TaxID=1537369 RepID=A0A916Z174_9BACT|nr:DUF1573 domain-containing protein [Emticicia aquatilis]GGD71410.1 hypothetical protein GCM10011514_39370 [Emticicia aquatilis]
MKKVFLALTSTIILAGLNFSCNLIDSKGQTGMSQEDSLAALANAPIMEFDKEVFDFGTLTEGDTVSHAFKFKNVGKSALTITDVQVQCGCTVASKPDHPVGVGQSDQIVVRFNSKGKVGTNKKFVTIFSNANPPQTVLAFTAIVYGKDMPDSAKAALKAIPKL